MKVVSVCLMSVSALVIFPSSHVTFARPVDTPIRVNTTQSGLKLSLLLPHRTYPRNALVRVSIRVQNVSNHAIDLARNGCPFGTVYAEVLTKAGFLAYPPITPGWPHNPCPRFMPIRTLMPHHALTRHTYVILRGPRMKAAVLVHSTLQLTRLVTGAILSLHLVSGKRPHVTLYTSGELSATLRPAVTPHGPLLWNSWARCDDGRAYGTNTWLGGGGSLGRTIAPSVFAPPDCTVSAWYAFAGWVGQPIARITYPRAPGT